MQAGTRDILITQDLDLTDVMIESTNRQFSLGGSRVANGQLSIVVRALSSCSAPSVRGHAPRTYDVPPKSAPKNSPVARYRPVMKERLPERQHFPFCHMCRACMLNRGGGPQSHSLHVS